MSEKTGVYITMKDIACETPSGIPQTDSRDITLSQLEACLVDLLAEEGSVSFDITAIYGRGLRQCVILAGAIKGSVRLEDCVGCVVVVGCHQVLSSLVSYSFGD